MPGAPPHTKSYTSNLTPPPEIVDQDNVPTIRTNALSHSDYDAVLARKDLVFGVETPCELLEWEMSLVSRDSIVSTKSERALH